MKAVAEGKCWYEIHRLLATLEGEERKNEIVEKGRSQGPTIRRDGKKIENTIFLTKDFYVIFHFY